MTSMETSDDRRSDIVSVLARYPAADERQLGGYQYVVVTQYAGPAELRDIENEWSGRSLPQVLVEFWSQVTSAVLLFREGSDGLRILSPTESRVASEGISIDHEVGEEFFHDDDFILGEFQGYDWLLVFSPEEGWMVTGESGDRRENWVHLGSGIDRFLEVFLRVGGTDGDWETPFVNGSYGG
ncbi:hypothetical protein JVX90_18655 [Gordonia sp. PDNC005]|uniref:hypothetical protein n=1 Tax=unclassified Gordonia (in: high G+C Gram-positive bacteria) TaxID=2657482 RepID=UPI0019654FAD|nr:hypothetical protein [Gordonia sp. PDNC005]QRY62368.1 hypothetical protein JVX90_18655 [Gordonia sp. PDNC005]